MATPPASRLDGNQCLQGAFDEDRGRFRVDSDATIVNADIDVSLEAFEDNVAIATPDGNFLEIETDGSINTNSKTLDENGAAFTDSNYLPVGQLNHDELNVNANIQYDNSDITRVNPLPVYQPRVNKTSYGDQIYSNLVAIILGSFEYNFLPSNFRLFESGGSSSFIDSIATVSSGTSIGNYSSVQSFRSVNHRPGEGTIVRLSARFPTNASNTWSGVGLITIGEEFSFGYSGTTYGIWHRYGGKAEVRTLTLTSPATSPGNATVTLNGTAYVVPLTVGSLTHNTKEIAEYIAANSTEFYADQIGSTVIFAATSDGPKNGTYSLTTATGAVGTIAQNTAGVTKTSVHIPRGSWNGEDTSWLDPYFGNSYQIIFENGYSDINFYVQSQQDGVLVLAHTLRWSNLNTVPNTYNPSMRLGFYATAIGSTTGASVQVSHLSAFVSGGTKKTRNPRAFFNTKSIATTRTPILTIKNRRTFKSLTNQSEIEPVQLTLANDGLKSAVFNIYAGGTLGPDYNYVSQGTNLISLSEITATTLTGGNLLGSFTVAKGQSVEINLSDFEIRVPPTLQITVTGEMTSGAASDLTAAFVWYEDL